MFNDATPNERLIMVTRFVRRKTKLLFFEINNFLIKNNFRVNTADNALKAREKIENIDLDNLSEDDVLQIETTIKELFQHKETFENKEVVLFGWVRNHRSQKSFGFINFWARWYFRSCFQ